MAQIAVYFLALLSLSTAPNWAKLNQMPPEVLGFWRLGIAMVLLIPIMFWKKQWSKTLFSRHSYWVLLSGFFFFLHLWTYKYAAKNTLVSNTMILFALNPIWASLGGIVFFKERLQMRIIAAYILALASLSFFLYRSITFDPSQASGNWAAVISALFFAIYMISGKKARQHVENIPYAFMQYGICAACFFLASLGTGADFIDYGSTSWIAVLGLVLIPTFLGHFSMTYLVKHIDLSVLTCGKLIEPILASLIAFAVFNEHLLPGAGIAFIGTATSVIILFWPQLMRRANFLN